jgi:tetratricopeptide (TPR) repeat protein
MQRILTIIAGLATLLAMVGIIGWAMWRSLKQSDDPRRLIVKWIVSALLLVFLLKSATAGVFGAVAAAIFGVILGIMWAPNLGAMLAKPFSSMYDGGDQELEPAPLYSIAEAKRKQGKYLESVAEIRKQLHNFPEDFACWMMLADIQAENLHDLAGAEDSVERVLTHKEHLPKNIAYALNRLADWQLKFNQDPEAARQTLERIPDLLPDTEEAQTARQRIAHLATKEELVEKQERTPIALPHHEEHIGLREDFSGLKPAPEDPAKLAQDYVRHLAEFPNDNEAREKLALVYADHYHRLDMAADQLEQLIAVAHQQPKQIVHWLNLLADLQIKIAGDAALAKQTLQRIVDANPKSAAAENARNRIARLKLELKPQQKSQEMKLGSYEENLGLAGKKPTRL